jgi:hypothetical protein
MLAHLVQTLFFLQQHQMAVVMVVVAAHQPLILQMAVQAAVLLV